jgi:NAD-dependent DNA ligase
LEAKNSLIGDKDKQIKSIEDGRKADLTAKIGDLQKAQDDFDRQLGAKNKTWQDEMAKQAALTAEKDKQLTALSKEMETKNADLHNRDTAITKLETDVRNLKGTPNLGEVAMKLPDGKISKALSEQGVVYINIGQQEQVTPGLPFAVFPSTGIPADGKPKAKIIVSSVGPNVSEAKIVEVAKDEVITENDLISNLVYNPHRQMNFVVEGEFDLYNQGRPDADGVKRVKGLIQSFGGKVDDEMSLTTDYLVVGAEPPRPPKPADDANAATMQMYNEQMKKADQYKALMDQARALQVPVLNTSRFLALTGYVPPKRFSR